MGLRWLCRRARQTRRLSLCRSSTSGAQHGRGGTGPLPHGGEGRFLPAPHRVPCCHPRQHPIAPGSPPAPGSGGKSSVPAWYGTARHARANLPAAGVTVPKRSWQRSVPRDAAGTGPRRWGTRRRSDGGAGKRRPSCRSPGRSRGGAASPSAPSGPRQTLRGDPGVPTQCVGGWVGVGDPPHHRARSARTTMARTKPQPGLAVPQAAGFPPHPTPGTPPATPGDHQ